MVKWTHSDLGTFKFDGFDWETTVLLPAFKAFKYRGSGRNIGRSKIPLCIEAESIEDIPPRPLITIANRVIRNQESLVKRLKKSLFNDIQGIGPDSGMWWHGDIKSVESSIEDTAEDNKRGVVPLNSPEDLELLLGSPSIRIRLSGIGYDKPCAVLRLHAMFEYEHGVGILTDGNRVLGTGYASDVGTFK